MQDITIVVGDDKTELITKQHLSICVENYTKYEPEDYYRVIADVAKILVGEV